MFDPVKEQLLNAVDDLRLLKGQTGISVIAREAGLVLSTPQFSRARPSSNGIVIATLQGRIISGNEKPTKYLKSHTRLYRESTEIGAIVHCCIDERAECARTGPVRWHRFNQTIEIGCTRTLTESELSSGDNGQVAIAILDRVGAAGLAKVPGLIVGGLGCFAWGESLEKALKNISLIRHIRGHGRGDLETNPDGSAQLFSRERLHSGAPRHPQPLF